MPPWFPDTFLLTDGYSHATIGSHGAGKVNMGKDAPAEIEAVAVIRIYLTHARFAGRIQARSQWVDMKSQRPARHFRRALSQWSYGENAAAAHIDRQLVQLGRDAQCLLAITLSRCSRSSGPSELLRVYRSPVQ